MVADVAVKNYNMASETGDMYRFSHATPGDLTFFMTRDNSNGKGMVWPEMIIYDENQNQIATAKNGAEAYKLIENAPAGDYYVLAKSDNYQVSGEYTFRVRPTLDEIEPTFEDAVTLQPNTPSFSNYTREESGDMWTFDIGTLSDIQFVMVADDSNGNGLGNTEMTIYDGNRQQLANAYRASDNMFVLNDLPAGTYYILASARNLYDGDYRIEANQVDDIPGTFADATPIPASYTGGGNYIPIENGDMYTFTLTEASNFDADMVSYNAVWPRIRIYDSTQKQLVSSTGSAYAANVSLSDLAPGTYYMLAVNDSKIGGTYDIQTSATQAPQ